MTADLRREEIAQIGEALEQAWPKDGLLSLPQSGPSDALIDALYDAGLRSQDTATARTPVRKALIDMLDEGGYAWEQVHELLDRIEAEARSDTATARIAALEGALQHVIDEYELARSWEWQERVTAAIEKARAVLSGETRTDGAYDPDDGGQITPPHLRETFGLPPPTTPAATEETAP